MKTAKAKVGLAIKSILVPVDFSDPSKKALKYAAALAGQFGAKLSLLYVIEPLGTPDFMRSFPLIMEGEEMEETCKARLAKFAGQCAVKPKMVERMVVRRGRPFVEITDAARTLKADIIVISTHGYSGVTHAFMGSVTERVVRRATCPVLVVRENEREILAG